MSTTFIADVYAVSFGVCSARFQDALKELLLPVELFFLLGGLIPPNKQIHEY